ncbi:MAG: hypothetical protein QOF33_918 [Thermomicrobiales bacterium]|nr:hypothetical protein [Thermomicrobiales bacterium]
MSCRRRGRRAAGPSVAPAAPGGPAAASPPAGSPPQYSPALRRVTTGFGMGPGGTAAPPATDPPGTPGAHPRPRGPAPAPPTLTSRLSSTRARDPDSGPRGRTTTHTRPTPDAASVRPPALRPGPRAARPHRRTPAASRRERGTGARHQRMPPSAMSTARLRSVARRPPAASPPGGLPGALLPCGMGGLVLGRGSRLDAFSGSPARA